jgi:hypothetical protein
VLCYVLELMTTFIKRDGIFQDSEVNFFSQKLLFFFIWTETEKGIDTDKLTDEKIKFHRNLENSSEIKEEECEDSRNVSSDIITLSSITV